MSDKEYAFPGKAQYEEERGMTLRDWFAGQVISTFNNGTGAERIANYAYKIADAMLKEREKSTTT